ncbi:unnamed protein product, partial [Allacma fusca]
SKSEENENDIFIIQFESPEDLIKEFIELKNVMEAYKHIAGSYCLPVTIHSVFTFIRTLSHFLAPNYTQEISYDVKLTTTCCFFYIVLIASLGNYIQATVYQNRLQLGNTMAIGPSPHLENPKVLELKQWLLSYDFKLSACDFFEINHRLILEVAALVLTYFVFLFQLQISEKADSQP